jgi:hypothetical protein
MSWNQPLIVFREKRRRDYFTAPSACDYEDDEAHASPDVSTLVT